MEFISNYLYEIIFGGVMSVLGIIFIIFFGDLYGAAFSGNWGDRLRRK